jgi:hypothetical protein
LDPDDIRIDEGHHRLTRRDKLAVGQLQIGDDAVGWSPHDGIDKIALGGAQFRLRLADLRVVGALRPEVLAGLFDFSLGAIDIGVNLPNGWRGADVWEANQGRPGSWGGHSVPLIGYDAEYLYAVSWGQVIPMSYAALDQYVDEAYAVISPDWIAKDGITPSGFDLIKMRADLTAVAS